MSARTGTFTGDQARIAAAREAIQHLSMGKAIGTLTGDHTGTESCCQTISRLANISTSRLTDQALRDKAQLAILQLKSGRGVHFVAGDHAGGNTCVEVIASAANVPHLRDSTRDE